MSQPQPPDCQRCGATVAADEATTILVVRGDEKAWSIRCPDCPLVACDHCGNSVAVHDVLHGPVTGRPDHETCDRCGESVPADQTATLHQEHDRSYEKTLCSDCVSEVAVPPGYHLDRPSSR